MAPKRKSQGDAAVMAAAGEDGEGTTAALGEEESATTTAAPSKPVSLTKQQKDAASGADGIDQYELARTQVTKVAKSAVPENMQLRKEVILGLIKSSTVFISYLASAALDKTHEAGNKTLSATHVIKAFKQMGFPEEYATQLRREYDDKVKSEADRAMASKAAKADAARAEEQSMDVDGDAGEEEETEAAEKAPVLGDESIAVDLSKEGAEEEMEDEDENDDADQGVDEEADEEEDDREDEEDEEGVDGDLGGQEQDEAMGEQASSEQHEGSRQI